MKLQVLLVYSSSPIRVVVSVGDGLTMELIPLISAPAIVAADIINVHLTAFASLLLHDCLFLSAGLFLFSLSHFICAVFSSCDHKRIKKYSGAK